MHQETKDIVDKIIEKIKEAVEVEVNMPCPQGIKGCEVLHTNKYYRPKTYVEILHDIECIRDRLQYKDH